MLPSLQVCEIRPVGDLRGTLNEIILGIDTTLKRVAYSITDSPFGFTHHASSMRIVEDDGVVRFVWTTDVKPDEVATLMASTFETEAAHIARQLSRPG